MNAYEKDYKKSKLQAVKYYQFCIRCEKCGRSIFIGKKDKSLCPTCGRYLFKDKKKEFEYRLKGLI